MRDNIHPRFSATQHLFWSTAGLLICMGVGAQPTQRPLLVNTSGAKPNLMISLDNSASMSIPYPDQYNVGSGSSRGAYWAAHRSADVNHLYYNPRITYLPRVEADGKPMVPTDGIVFISNQASAPFEYRVFADTTTPQANSSYVIQHGSYASLPSRPDNSTQVSFEEEPGYTPKHIAYTAAQRRRKGCQLLAGTLGSPRKPMGGQSQHACQRRKPGNELPTFVQSGSFRRGMVQQQLHHQREGLRQHNRACVRTH